MLQALQFFTFRRTENKHFKFKSSRSGRWTVVQSFLKPICSDFCTNDMGILIVTYAKKKTKCRISLTNYSFSAEILDGCMSGWFSHLSINNTGHCSINSDTDNYLKCYKEHSFRTFFCYIFGTVSYRNLSHQSYICCNQNV